MAAIRLHESLLAGGVESRLWSTRVPPESPPPGVRRIEWGRRSGWRRSLDAVRGVARKLYLKTSMARALAGRPAGCELFTTPWQPAETRVSGDILDTDVIHLHWVSKMIDYESFFGSLPDGVPIVWTLHDMNPFSGGCHYSGGCQAYETECRNCPQVGLRSDRDLSNRSFQTKISALQNKNLHIVTPSHWLERLARQSRILATARSFQTIHYGLDVELFSPRDKQQARRRLGLNAEGVVFGFGAESLENERKGLRYLLAALSRLHCKQRIVGLVFGAGDPRKWGPDLPELQSVGVVQDEGRLPDIYSAVDMFVMPSLEDNSPQTGVEAMSCGIPVVAFDVGGIPDYVLPHETGLLARPRDVVDLARRIDFLAAKSAVREEMGRRARDLAVRLFHHHRQAEKYLALYESVVSERHCGQRAA